MQVTAQILVENTAASLKVTGEWGFSTLVNVDGVRYLFDTGSAGALLHNAQVMGVSLAPLEGLILSHGHFDHTGTVIPVLEQNPGLKTFANSNLFEKKYTNIGPDRHQDIGTPFDQEQLLASGAVFMPVDAYTEVGQGVYLSGPIPRKSGFEDVGGSFKVCRKGQMVDDLIEDEIALFIDHPEGLIVVSGCAHAGLINTLNYAMERTGRQRIRCFIGGTHLAAASAERINKTIEALQKIDFDLLAIGHCTGFLPAAQLFAAFGTRVCKAETGSFFQF